MKHGEHSLRHRFRKLSIRWSFIGLALTILIVTPTILAIVRHSSERQVEVMATALTRAFRPMILRDKVRDAQLQMQEVAKLKSNESVTLLDTSYKTIFLENPEEKQVDHCKSPGTPCWLSGGSLVSVLMPIYFDDDAKSELYGYLVLNLRPTFDWFEIFLIAVGGISIFIFQVFGIYSSLKREVFRVEGALSSWKIRIDNPKNSESDVKEKGLFAEFLPLDQSIRGLHRKISDLEQAAATTAATKAKIDLVRGLGHDLKTPLSQISKFFSIFVSNTKLNQAVNAQEVERIEGSLKRMGSIIRQVTNLGRRVETPSRTNLNLWLIAYCNELLFDTDITADGIKVTFDCTTQENIYVMINETDLFRIVDNLIRNAIEAMPQDQIRNGKLSLSLTSNNTNVVLSISDNGSGIPVEIQNNIFDLDFTTKKTRGTGLGLGIVQKICTDSGLTLGFSSIQDKGTTFNIEFPVVDCAAESSFKGEVVV